MIVVALYQIFVIWLAYKNASWSNPKESWKIKHWFNGLIHVVVSCLIGWGLSWLLAASNLLLTRVVFDAAMNIFRHLGLGYISPAPASWLDKQEKKLIFWIASIVHKKRTLITENQIKWVAIIFRGVLFVVAIILLFV